MFLKVGFFVVLAVSLFLVSANYLKIVETPVCNEKEDYFRVNLSDYPHCLHDEEESTRNYCTTAKFREQAQKYLEFRVRPDDVWLVGFPKSGTTWRDHLVWQLCNNLDMDINKTYGTKGIKLFEIPLIFRLTNNEDYLESLDKIPSPRFFKTHLPVPLLPKEIRTVKPKIVYMTRNVKDVALSGFHFIRNLGFNVTQSELCELFLRDRILYTPYDTHVTDFWKLRNEDNVLFITYESMKKDLPAIIRKTAGFFGKSLNEEQIESLAEYLSFTNLSINDNGFVNIIKTLPRSLLAFIENEKDFNFYRKGKVGTYLEEMSPEMIEKFNQWIHHRLAHHKDYPELLEIFMGRT